jgi:hypothetical protein
MANLPVLVAGGGIAGVVSELAFKICLVLSWMSTIG